MKYLHIFSLYIILISGKEGCVWRFYISKTVVPANWDAEKSKTDLSISFHHICD